MPKQSSATVDLDSSAEKIYAFYEKNLRMPSYSEVCKLCSISSKNTAHNLIKKLSATGKIKTDSTGKIIPNGNVTKSVSAPAKHTKGTITDHQLTVLGLVEAGFPTPSEESMHDKVSLDEWVIEKKEASFMLKVKGDSMKDAGILDGDMVIVERTRSARTGQIIVAEVDGSYTMKYLRKDAHGKFFLEAANSAYKPIRPKESLQITAVVKAVVRKY